MLTLVLFLAAQTPPSRVQDGQLPLSDLLILFGIIVWVVSHYRPRRH